MKHSYSPSGKVSLRAALVLPALFALAAAGGVAYAWAWVTTPMMWLFYFSIVFFLAGLGIAVDRALTFAHWRNPTWGALTGFAVAATFLLAGYIGLYQLDPVGAKSGAGFVEYFSARLSNGVPLWKTGGATPAWAVGGWLLIGLWLLEAGAFIIVAMGAADAAVSRIYCEQCRSWASRALWKFRLRNASPRSVELIEQAQSFDAFLTAASLSTGNGPIIEYAVRGCRCGRAASLHIKCIERKKDDQKEEKTLREDIALTSRTLVQLFDWAERLDGSLAGKRPKLELTDGRARLKDRRPLAEDDATVQLLKVQSERQFFRWAKWLGASDSYVDNEFTKAVRVRVKAGDYLAAEEAIRMQRHPDDLAFVSEAMADWDFEPSWLTDWLEERPDSFVPRMVRGIWYLKWGWHARGLGWKPKSPGDFLERLRIADRELQHAASLEPRDPVSRSWLVYTAMGLGLPKSEALRRFEEAIAKYPHHRPAYSFIVDCMTTKWGGRDEAALDLARRGSANAPAGKSVHVVLAEAHLQLAGSLARDQGKTQAIDDYLRSPAVRAELRAANEKLFRPGSFKPTMDTPRARQFFAYALWRAGETDAAADHLRIIGKSSPWTVFSRNWLQGRDTLKRAWRECGVN